MTYHDNYDNGFFVYWRKANVSGKKAVGDKTYFVQENGTVKTDLGVVQDTDGSRYYVIDDVDGALQMTVGFTPDRKYYVENTEGKIHTNLGKFQANDGKSC